MKKVISWILTIALLFSLMPAGTFTLTAEAATVAYGKCGTNLTWTLDGAGTLTISGTGDMTTFTSTSSVPWKNYANSVKTVVVESGVTSIGRYAFANHTNLNKVTISNTVTKLNAYAFRLCTSLTEITIPNSVTSIGDGTFMDCINLESVVMPNSVTKILDAAFGGCTKLKRLTLPDSVKTIFDYAFRDCVSLESVTISANVTRIYSGTFSNCSNLREIIFKSNAPKFDDNTVFLNVTATAYYPENNATWTEDVRQNYGGNITWVARERVSEGLEFTLSSDGTYYSVTGIGTCKDTDIVIPSTYEGKPVKAIGVGAFVENTDITSVKIPDSVTSIGTLAFSKCTSLTGIWVNEGNANYSSDAAGVLFNKSKTELIQAPGGISGSYTIPDSVTRIGDYAFFCAGLTGELIIPDSVTSVGAFAFSKCVGLTSVKFGSSVETIGDGAFSDCTGWTGELIIPDGMTRIENTAFYSCSSLTSVTIPASVTSIGQFSLGECTALQELCFEGSAPAISANSFYDVTATAYYYPDETWTEDVRQNYGGTITWVARERVSEGLEFTLSDDGTYYSVTGIGTCTDTDIVIPDTHEGKPVKTIGYEAFKENTNITSVKIPDSVTSIGHYAFFGCTGLTGELIIPDSVTFVGYETFCSCTSLTSLTLGSNVETIMDRAFCDCTGLTGELIIPDSVTSMGAAAFHNCASLSSVTIGSGVKIIENWTFGYCSGLTSLSIGGSVETIYSNAFRGCTSLTSLDLGNNVKTIKGYAFCDCTGLTGELTIPDSVTSIGSRAFEGCTGLTSVTIGKSVESIEECAFMWCSNLTGIWVNSDNDYFTSDKSGVLFNKDKSKLIQAPETMTGSYTIPDSVTSIGNYAFFNCTGLTGVIIGNNVKTIGYYAFCDCTGLTSVTIPDSTTSIQYRAFQECTGLKEIYFAGSAPAIGNDVFLSVTAMAYYYPDETWTEDVRKNYGGKITWVARQSASEGLEFTLSSDGTYYSVTGIGTCKDTDIVIPDTHLGKPVKAIGSVAFMDNSNITSINIPDSVTSIGERVFFNCTSLVGIWVDDNNDQYSSDEFGVLFNKDKTVLVQAPESLSDGYIIPDSVTSIGDYAFYRCVNLASITVPNSVTSIGDETFYGCTGLTSVTIGNSVKTIDIWAFWFCTNLKEIHFEGSAPAIAANAFKYVTATAYYYPDETWTEHVRQNYGGDITWVALSNCEHDFTEWMPIELDGVTYKIRACKKCGYIETDLPENVVHLHDWQWESKDPTCTEPGYKDYIWCKNCDLAVSKILIDPLGHDESGDWVQGTDKHWKICQRPECGDKILEADHSHGQWVEDTPAKCETAGTKHRTCECGHIEYGTDPKLGHDDSDAWHYDANGHWKICQRPECGETILLENHQHNMLVGSVPATCTEQGYNIYSCKCEHTENRDFNGPLEHIPGSWQFNGTHHWKTCQRSGCGEQLNKAAHNLKIEKVEVTCTKDGYTTYSCDCGYFEKRDVVTALGHDDSGEWYYNDDQHWKICDRDNCDEKILKAGHSYGNWVVDTEAKCETAGSKHRTCTTCGYVQRETITIPGHDESASWHYDANGHWKICQRPGCGEKILAADHSLQKGKVTDPTCTEQGYTTYHCVCGYSVKKDFTDAKFHDDSGKWLYNDTQHWKICQRPKCGETILLANHQHNMLVDSVSATCTEHGYSIYACKCGHTENRDFNGPLEHIPGSWQFNGTHHWKTCQRSGCGEQLNKAAHNLKIEKVEVTCTKDGYTTYSCDCGYFEKRDVVTALGHDDSGEWYYNDDQHWKICDRDNCDEKILKAGHSYGNWVVDTEAKCETAGSKHRTCTTCGYIHREEITKLDHIQSGVWHYDANGHWKICQRPGCGEKILTADHSLQKGKVTDPTCTEQGYTTYHCVCGYSVKKDFTDAKIHDDSGKWLYNDTQHWKICQRPECGKTILLANHKFTTVKVDATCTEQGYTTYSCNCGYTDKRDEVTIPGHDYNGAWYYDANGHWKICQRSGCNEKLLTADHSYGDWVVDTAAKCATAGSKHRTCTTCDYVQREVIPAPGHDDSGSWQYNDSKHWKVCGECGENIQTSNHSYGNWITDVAAECEKDGSKHRNCMCGYTEYGVIPAKGHDHSGPWQKDESGHWKICGRDNCDKILDKSGHNYGEYILKTDKSTQNGITVFTHCVVSECGKCGYEWSSDSTDVHIHERVTVIHSVEPTCTEPGSTVGLICAECGEVLIATTVVPALGHHFVDGVCDRCGAIYMIGDVNGDGMVNSLDGLILMRYLNGWNVKVAVPEAMDVNCDGKVNSLDGLILMRYLNGWNVTLG